MNFIKEYAQHSQYGEIVLPRGIALSHMDRKELNRIIADELTVLYNMTKDQAGDAEDNLVFGDRVIVPEYLFKAINNTTILKWLVNNRNINTKEELFDFIKNNSFELFHYDGRYFNYIYDILLSCSTRGEERENSSFEYFEKIAKSKGINTRIFFGKKYISSRMDRSGIDGYFYYNGKKFTIQVKPLDVIKDDETDDTKFVASSSGDVKDLVTDYLILSNSFETLIFRAKGIRVSGLSFFIPKGNLVV
jgi:hypothetical protein